MTRTYLNDVTGSYVHFDFNQLASDMEMESLSGEPVEQPEDGPVRTAK